MSRQRCQEPGLLEVEVQGEWGHLPEPLRHKPSPKPSQLRRIVADGWIRVVSSSQFDGHYASA
jgi:hypothetical protein